MKTKDPISLVTFWLFVSIVAACLIAAIFFDATHQLFTAGLCGIAAFVVRKTMKLESRQQIKR